MKKRRPGSPLNDSIPAVMIIILIVLLIIMPGARAAENQEETSRSVAFIDTEKQTAEEENTERLETEIEFITEIPNTSAEPDIQPATPTDLIKPNNKTKLTEEDFEIQYGDIVIRLGDTPENAVNEIEKNEDDEIEICSVDKSMYAPSGIEYDTERIGIRCTENDEISAIFVDSEGIRTNRGISVGDNIEKIKEVYGENYSKIVPDLIVYSNKYKADSPTIIFQMNEDTVLSIAVVVNKLQN